MYHPPNEFFIACDRQGLPVKDAIVEVLQVYLTRLLETNQQLNLTAVRNPEEAWLRHILDSLLLLPHLKSDAGRSLIDIGSGGGLPAIPLAICRPDLELTLVESTGKKASFLEGVAAELGLKNVHVFRERAEILGRDPAHRGRYHLATARAVAALPTLLEYTLPFLREGGVLLAMKGGKAEEELQASKVALDRLRARFLRKIPKEGGGNLLVIKKTGPTPKSYPRAPGVPGKTPLG